jgi:hypothetical protein
MKIKCINCEHVETTDKDFFVKLIGGAMPVGGFWAWTTYLFAGTGFAMVIVVAIIGGGVAMLIFKDEIVEWIINKDYKCPECGQLKWKADDGSEVDVAAITENCNVVNELTDGRSTIPKGGQATETESTALSRELIKGAALLSSAVVATPGFVKEVIKTPITATAAFQAEDQGISYSEAELALLARLPSTASEAVKQGVIEASRLIAQLMKEEEAVK